MLITCRNDCSFCGCDVLESELEGCSFWGCGSVLAHPMDPLKHEPFLLGGHNHPASDTYNANVTISCVVQSVNAIRAMKIAQEFFKLQEMHNVNVYHAGT